MVIEVGKLAGNAIVPYSQSTKRTKVLTLTDDAYIVATGLIYLLLF